MNNVTDPKVFQKILSRNVFLPLALAATLCGIFIFIILHLLTVRQWVDHSNRVIALTNQTLKQIVDAETGVRGYLITGRENFLEPYRGATNNFDQNIKILTELVSDNPGQETRIQEIQKLFHEWDHYAVDVLSLKRNHHDYVRAVDSERGKTLMDSIRRSIDDLSQTEERLRNDRDKKTEEAVRLSLFLIVISSLAVGTVLALYSRKQLLLLSTEYANSLEKQLEQNEALKELQWLQTGQTQLTYEMRGEQSIDKLGTKIVEFLAQYLNAQVGTLYNLEGVNSFRRISSFALSEEQIEVRKSIKIGQTLVGQAAAERKTFCLTEVPVDYLHVSSGIGQALPRTLLIVPAPADNEVQGVIEFGFISTPPPRIRELLERVSESIGLALRTAQIRFTVQSLLEESQRQSEELQVQQEELKVSNEELEEQSRALKISQGRLENQQAELEQINSQLEGQNQELNHARIGLKQKARELEMSSQYKSQFLANMSHELRTPLNSTLILSQLLMENRRKNLQAEEVEYAKTIFDSSNDLLVLINDILDLSKVEAGKIDLQSDVVDLKSLVRGLEGMFVPMAQNKDIIFTVEIDPRAPQNIQSDKQRLEQILKNLISNALKFTQKGEVKLIVSISETDSNRMLFSVVDTGIGISKGQQEVIFEAFRQADGTTNRRFGGTGLGLTISRDLAKLLGGFIKVDSEVGKGSTFSLALPVRGDIPLIDEGPSGVHISTRLKKVTNSAARTGDAPKLAFKDDRESDNPGIRVLLVIEDDQAFAKILYDLSHEMKFNCIVAITAEEGISLAEDFLPSAVILDMKLPDHSGLTVLDYLKDNPKTRHIPVHIVSAEDHSRVAFEMGAIGYLTKPADRTQLKRAIEKLEAKFTQEFKRVLIVEDNKVQRDSICSLIEDASVKTTAVETGLEALAELDKQEFDCMIVDLNLPDMTGNNLLEKVRQIQSTRYLPVIVYTGRDITRKEEEQLKKYSNSIIIKGARSPERLLSEVTLFLHQVESKMPIERQHKLQDLRDREKIFDGKRILLADDDVRNIFALSSALESKGALVITARNGLEAVAAVKNDPEIDLVLMDIMMPEMDGYQAMKVIRSDSRFSKLPIIAVTAKAMPDDQKLCVESGANDYLSKPVDLSKLLSLIRVWLTKDKS